MKGKRIIHKLTAMLLTLTMLLGLFPLTAFAAPRMIDGEKLDPKKAEL